MATLVSRGVLAVAAAGLALSVAGCGYVKRKDFDSEVARIRDEMQTGDRNLGTRIDSTNTRVDALERELTAFRSEYNVSIERMKGMLKFNVPVHFEFGSADLREADRPVLDRFAGVMKEHYPNAVITVEGFADPAGSTRYNLRLGQRRAETVSSYLASNGALGATQLRTVSYGEARNRQVAPGAKGQAEDALKNRRVTLVIEDAQVSDSAAPSSVSVSTN